MSSIHWLGAGLSSAPGWSDACAELFRELDVLEGEAGE